MVISGFNKWGQRPLAAPALRGLAYYTNPMLGYASQLAIQIDPATKNH